MKTIFLLILTFALPAFGQTTEAGWRNEAIKRYPDLATPDSSLNLRFVNEHNRLRKSSPEYFANPKWPLLLVRRCFDDLYEGGVNAATATAKPSSPQQPQPPPEQTPALATKPTSPTELEPAADATPPTPGENKIEGAFGKKLGATFYPSAAIATSALTDGTPMYQFTPDKPFRSFTHYFVMVTPATHKIYAIWGLGPAGHSEAGKKEQALVMELLQQKYGERDKDGLFDGFHDAKHISQGSRFILTKITGFTDTTLEVRYEDKDLEKIAEQERLKIEGKKVDPSGL